MFVSQTHSNRESIVPSGQAKDQIASVSQINAVQDLVVEEGEALVAAYDGLVVAL